MENIKQNKSLESISTEQQLINARQEVVSEISDPSFRIEWKATVNGVEYVNDAKATNLIMSLEAMEQLGDSIIWIMQNMDIVREYPKVSDMVKSKVKAIIYLGNKPDDDILQTIRGHVDLYCVATNVEEAVESASQFGVKGDVVLYSPATPGYELLENYKVRGDKFNQEIIKLG